MLIRCNSGALRVSFVASYSNRRIIQIVEVSPRKCYIKKPVLFCIMVLRVPDSNRLKTVTNAAIGLILELRSHRVMIWEELVQQILVGDLVAMLQQRRLRLCAAMKSLPSFLSPKFHIPRKAIKKDCIYS